MITPLTKASHLPRTRQSPIHKISAIKTIEIIKPIATKGSLETLKRLCQRLNEIIVRAVNTDIIDANSLTGISKAFKNPEKQHLPTLKPEQLPTLLPALSVANIKLTTRSLIEWQLHAMVRPSEAAGTRWAEIDLEQALWNIPAEHMKNQKSHRVPLTSQCLALFELMRPMGRHGEFVFPSTKDPRKHANTQTTNTALKPHGV